MDIEQKEQKEQEEQPDYPLRPDLSFMEREHKSMKSAYRVVRKTDSWSILANMTDQSFMYTNDSNIIILMHQINNAYQGHSCASLDWTMRQLSFIAKHGFTQYRTYWR